MQTLIKIHLAYKTRTTPTINDHSPGKNLKLKRFDAAISLVFLNPFALYLGRRCVCRPFNSGVPYRAGPRLLNNSVPSLGPVGPS